MTAQQRLPRNFTETVRRWQKLMPTLAGTPDLSQEVETRRRELVQLLEPVDAIDLLGQLVLSEMPWRAETYVESEHEGSAYSIELVAALMAARPSRLGSRTPGQVIDAQTLRPLRELVGEIAMLEGLRRYKNAGALRGNDPLGGAKGRAAMAHLMLRAPAWPWQEHEVLRGLFGPFSSKLQGLLGFDADYAIACTQAAPRLISRRLQAHFTDAPNHVNDALTWARGVFRAWPDDLAEPTRNRALAAIWALMHSGDAMLLAPAEIAAEAAVPLEVVQAFLEALSTPFGQTSPFFRVAETVRFRPYLVVSEIAYFLTVPGNDLWALRPLFEDAVKGDRYTRHRGRWLEERAMELLISRTQPDEHHRGVRIVDPDTRTEIGEIDGLLRFGDAVLIVEAKAATMRQGARRGGDALEEHLKATLTQATRQAGLAAEVLQRCRPGVLHAKTGGQLQLGDRIREVHPVLISLDDLSSVGPVAWEVVGSRVLPEDVPVPWMVTLHELDLVTEMVTSPLQMVHFLRRRARLNRLGGRIVHEELDWWMLYLENGLYFEADPPADPVRYLSQTDALDAWVLHDRGLRDHPAPKPHQRLGPFAQRMLDRLSAERPSGWIPAGCALLDASSETRERIGRDMDEARHRARERNLVQRGSYTFRDASEPMLVCWIVAPDSQASHLLELLGDLVEDALGDPGPPRVLGLALTESSSRPYDALLVVEQKIWEGHRRAR